MAPPTPEYSPHELDELLSAFMPEIPGYRVVRLLGRGGMSYVYLGIEESLDRQVAIKVVKPEALTDEVSQLRFEKEARTIAKLQHPCIVGIHAVGRMDLGLLYYVMPYLSRGHVGQRNLCNDEPRLTEVLRSVLHALDYAHAHGVVHRDVKAENVLFDHNDRPLLTDFGIATSKRDMTRVTGSGQAVGSSAYMAPEQARGESVDRRADIYSLGVLTFEMLTGALPFQHADPVSLALMHAVDPIPRLPANKAHWQDFIDRAMAKSPEQRYTNAREMLTALERISHAPRASEQPSRRHLLMAALAVPHGLRRPLLLTAALAFLLLLGGLLFWAFSAGDAGKDSAASPVASAPVAVVPTTAVAAAPVIEPDSVPAPSETSVVASETPEPVLPEAPALSPLEAALAAAEQQITRRRLTQPRGDNALQSLLDAHRLAPRAKAVQRQGERWLQAAAPYIENALTDGDDATAKALLDSAGSLNSALKLDDSEAWRNLDGLAVNLLRRQLQAALRAKDINALHAAKQRAAGLGVAAVRLQPEYDQAIVLAQVGDPLKHGSTTLSLIRLPKGKQPGMAISPTAITRSAYAAFSAAENRDASKCRNRTALLSLKQRRWDDPGFAQLGDHPVVCVSVADAEAFAAWLSRRDGVRYRLPSAAEWRAAMAAPAGLACGNGVLCNRDGTASAREGKAYANGVNGMFGNVREWIADCAGCEDHPSVGIGWREAKASANDANLNPAYGYDDLGFRLLREVPREEIERR